jgi:hypothetical protein
LLVMAVSVKVGLLYYFLKQFWLASLLVLLIGLRDRWHRKPMENRTNARKVGQTLSENILNFNPRTLVVLRGVATKGKGGPVIPLFFPKLRKNWRLGAYGWA